MVNLGDQINQIKANNSRPENTITNIVTITSKIRKEQTPHKAATKIIKKERDSDNRRSSIT